MTKQTIIKREKLEQIIEHRNQALALVNQGFELLRKADQEFRFASLNTRTLGIFASLKHSDWFALESDSHMASQRLNELVEKCRKRIDSGTWEHIINHTRISRAISFGLGQ